LNMLDLFGRNSNIKTLKNIYNMVYFDFTFSIDKIDQTSFITLF